MKELEVACLRYSTWIDYVQNNCHSDGQNELGDSEIKAEMDLFDSDICEQSNLHDLLQHTIDKIKEISDKSEEYQVQNGPTILKSATEKLVDARLLQNKDSKQEDSWVQSSVKACKKKTLNCYSAVCGKLNGGFTRLKSSIFTQGWLLYTCICILMMIILSVYLISARRPQKVAEIMKDHLTYDVVHAYNGISRGDYQQMTNHLQIWDEQLGDFKVNISKHLQVGSTSVFIDGVRYAYFGALKPGTDNDLEGQGVLVSSNGYVRMGSWNKNKLHNQGRTVDRNCIQGDYKEGKIIGPAYSYTI